MRNIRSENYYVHETLQPPAATTLKLDYTFLSYIFCPLIPLNVCRIHEWGPYGAHNTVWREQWVKEIHQGKVFLLLARLESRPDEYIVKVRIHKRFATASEKCLNIR